jgi:hypothetical protein
MGGGGAVPRMKVKTNAYKAGAISLGSRLKLGSLVVWHQGARGLCGEIDNYEKSKFVSKFLYELLK